MRKLTALIEFVADNVEPLATGARGYLVLDGSDERRLDIVRQVLDDPDREQLVDVLVRERLVRDDLRRGLEHRARCAAVDEFASLLSGNHPESVWQRWFERAGARSHGPGLTAKAGAAATSASKTKHPLRAPNMSPDHRNPPVRPVSSYIRRFQPPAASRAT